MFQFSLDHIIGNSHDDDESATSLKGDKMNAYEELAGIEQPSHESTKLLKIFVFLNTH